MFRGRWVTIPRNFQYCEGKTEVCKDEKIENKKTHQVVIIAAMETEQRTITTCQFLLAPTVKKSKMLKFQGQELPSITKYFAILGFTNILPWSCLVSKAL